MEKEKPKKALRNLFVKTEPSTIESVHQEYSVEKNNGKKNNEHNQLALGANPSLKSKEAISQQEIDSDYAEQKLTSPSESHSTSKDKKPSYSFIRIQCQDDLFKSERAQWAEKDYISFIYRIEQAQTDAFFLKGRLISEIKERFYINNKKGWADFCEKTLNMNYTTANQYIRVAQEFDVTSHPRKDFGFEHFKALLPLDLHQRTELIEQTPSNLSVKQLRELVSQRINTKHAELNSSKNQVSSRDVVSTLQKLKTQLHKLVMPSLTQEEKWQLYGAFQNLSEEMAAISNFFVSKPEPSQEPTFNS